MAQDRFFESEVNADVRSDRAVELFRKYKWVLLALVIGIIALVAFASYRSNAMKQQSEAQYNAISDVLDGKGNVSVLDDYPSALSKLTSARALQNAGDVAGAIAAFQSIADDQKASLTMRQFAKLQILSIQNDDATAQSADLARPGEAFQIQAKLLEADRLLGEGRDDEALVVLEAILANPEMNSERAFVEQVILSLGGTLESGDVSDDGSNAGSDAMDQDATDASDENSTETQ